MRILLLIVMIALLIVGLELQGSEQWKALRDQAIAMVDKGKAASPSATAKKKKPRRKKSRRSRKRSRTQGLPQSQQENWSIQGDVYDILTLEPISNATIEFREDPTKPAVITKTDVLGHFSATLPPRPQSGYTASFTHPKYDTIFLEESRAPYKRWSLDRRQDAFSEALTAEVLHVPIFGDVAGITYNIAALPKSGQL